MNSVLMQARASGKSAFIPFVMAGDPDLATSEKIILELHKAGADVLELGIPFSDPIADGITVQRAAERALEAGTTLESVLALVTRLRAQGVTMPICLFSYLNPVYHLGYKNFITRALAAGANGALLVDLPPEEAHEYVALARAHKFETVFLCSPTTTDARLKLVDDCSSGFVYYVSREGVTGAQSSLPQKLEARLAALRTQLKNPIGVGFGISTPEHMRQLAGKSDGIVVGSALVKLVEESRSQAVNLIGERAKALKTAV